MDGNPVLSSVYSAERGYSYDGGGRAIGEVGKEMISGSAPCRMAQALWPA